MGKYVNKKEKNKWEREKTDRIRLQKVMQFYKKMKRMPSYEEAAKVLGLRSKAGAFKAIQKLLSRGLVDKSDFGKLVPGGKFGNVKILGLVEAGFPTPAEENFFDSTSLDDYLVENPEATFMLKVKGDSMYDAGIREGDMVLVERTHFARPGQIVVAEVDGAWTMKYLRSGKSGFYLEAANEKYKPIIPKENLEISAVVKAVIRKY